MSQSAADEERVILRARTRLDYGTAHLHTTRIPAVNLRNKIALVTGATAGIGREAAMLLAAEGGEIIVTGRHSERGAATIAAPSARLPRMVSVPQSAPTFLSALTSVCVSTDRYVTVSPDCQP